MATINFNSASGQVQFAKLVLIEFIRRKTEYQTLELKYKAYGLNAVLEEPEFTTVFRSHPTNNVVDKILSSAGLINYEYILRPEVVKDLITSSMAVAKHRYMAVLSEYVENRCGKQSWSGFFVMLGITIKVILAFFKPEFLHVPIHRKPPALLNFFLEALRMPRRQTCTWAEWLLANGRLQNLHRVPHLSMARTLVRPLFREMPEVSSGIAAAMSKAECLSTSRESLTIGLEPLTKTSRPTHSQKRKKINPEEPKPICFTARPLERLGIDDIIIRLQAELLYIREQEDRLKKHEHEQSDGISLSECGINYELATSSMAKKIKRPIVQQTEDEENADTSSASNGSFSFQLDCTEMLNDTS